MNTKKLVHGTGAAFFITLIGLSPMLFGQTFLQVLDMPVFGMMAVFGATATIVGVILIATEAARGSNKG